MIRLSPAFFTITSLLFIWLSPISGNSQTKITDKEETVKSQKIAFFTEKLNLTPDEAQTFWPVYNSYWQQKNKIIEERKATMKFCSENMDKLSPKEIEQYGDMYINFHMQESNLLIEYNEKFKQVLAPEKVMRLYLADYEFKTYLLKQLRNKTSKNPE
jgi:hypothetical protein